jgi:hypothetical protein
MQRPLSAIAAAIALFSSGSALANDDPSFELIGRYTTGLEDVEGEVTAAETAALRHDRMYVTNATDVSLDIVNVRNPRKPRLLTRLDLKPYGATKVNSVAVSDRGLVAVAVELEKKTDPGVVLFIAPWGSVLSEATVGALPDMVTFTPDGKKLLVANEGEPDCYFDPADVDECPEPHDPNGSVSIVDVTRVLNPRVTTLDFDNVPLPAEVRIYGPNATPAQDVEPEYITVSDDSLTAYVTLQENNAIATIDLSAARITAVRSLGFKDFNTPAETELFEIGNLPPIGTTLGGQTIALGGFSGLFYEGTTRSGKLTFVTHTDRGPNAEPTGLLRPFLLPSFAPRIVRLELDPDTGSVTIKEQITLKHADGTPLTGIANTAISNNASDPYNDEVPVDLKGAVLPLDPLGGDYEGIVVADDGSFWLCDEYRPAIYHFDPQGKLLQRYIPLGTHAAVGTPIAPGATGPLGTEALPAVLAQRRQNRGFEGIALQGGKLYAFVQSPARNPTTLSNAQLNAMKNVRVVEFDPAAPLATRQFLYVLDNPSPLASADDTPADKIGDAAALPGGGFLVLERDDDATPDDPVSTITKRIYAFSLTGATEITAKDTTYVVNGVSKTLDQMTVAELTSTGVGVTPAAKVLRLDLATTAYNAFEKVEGLAVIDASTIAVVNDNDFRVAGISVDPTTGVFTLLPTYTPETEVLGLITTPGLDASDRDNVINIRNWPVYGMYQPDGIAAFTSGGQRYLLTANEGDARDWPGFGEEERARDIRTKYPNLPEVADNLQLGRLTVTDFPPLGDRTRPYVLGARSISIWNAATGLQVWDSGSDLEVLTADEDPLHFNSDNTANNFDNRSDNKGPEPEGVAVGRINYRTYAFATLERVGGVVVYDVTDPSEPEFVEYLVDRDFAADPVGPDSGPEVVHFVAGHENPTGKPLLVVANEISGTVSLWGLADKKPWWRHYWRRAWPARHH